MLTVKSNHRSFILSITDINDKKNRESAVFDKNNISLFFKKGNDNIFILNKDKDFLLNNIKKELDNSIDKYTNNGKNKEHLKKLEDRINSGGVKTFFDSKDKIISVKNINDIGDVEKIFTGLLSYKKKDSLFNKMKKNIYNTSSLEKMVFNDDSPIINSFISHKGQFYKIDHINESLYNKSNGGNNLLNIFSNENNNIGFHGCSLSIMKIEDEIQTNQESYCKVDIIPSIKDTPCEIKKIENEIKLIKNELHSKVSSHKKIVDVALAINNIVDFLGYKDISEINIDMLTRKKIEINNEFDIVRQLNSNEKIEDEHRLIEFKSSLEKIKTIKNEYYKSIESANYFGIELLIEVDNKLKGYTARINSEIQKENILLNINKIASLLFINNNSLENSNSFFSKAYKFFFPKSYQKRLDINNKNHGNIMKVHENLNIILNSDAFNGGKLPEWANKLITKTLKESKPKNDIFWFFSKERNEWNKIYNTLLLNK
ncbi:MULTISPECIES: hypothetical protein [Proteus]|uniref:hypothetical protein n=2 Tax=Morganellaceae TaxID=1903414 RepID=UPI0013781D09|nr:MULTISPECIES: hypothetical protein [Proteus]MCO8051360.1 hypothetical protein [Proteus penneri]MCX2588137.1 hypothetical protein [Proteus penneri]NBL76726.1 hypothetical protein [Proteus sp. G2672]NBM02657.1 hypothetical protein [Proteus sp. G2671]NBM48355.1 hypothetical protein [Proteus sp. G2666]